MIGVCVSRHQAQYIIIVLEYGSYLMCEMVQYFRDTVTAVQYSTEHTQSMVVTQSADSVTN